MRYFIVLNIYMIVDEIIVTIGISGQVESRSQVVKGTTEAISSEGNH
jgi:hypothetical protein